MTKKWRHFWSWYTAFSFYGRILKTWQSENDGNRGKINAIWWNIKTNLQKLVDRCGYEFPTNLQHFTQKDLTKVKIFLKVLGGYFFETPCIAFFWALLCRKKSVKIDPYCQRQQYSPCSVDFIHVQIIIVIIIIIVIKRISLDCRWVKITSRTLFIVRIQYKTKQKQISCINSQGAVIL